MKAVIAVLFCALAATAAYPVFTVKVVPDLVSGKPVRIAGTIAGYVYLHDHFYYFNEDSSKYPRATNALFNHTLFSGQCLTRFFIRDDRLCRQFFIITNKALTNAGFYDLEFTNSTEMGFATLSMAVVDPVRAVPLPLSLDGITAAVRSAIVSNLPALVRTDASVLYRGNPYRVKLQITTNMVLSDRTTTGLNSLRFMGESDGHCLYRMDLMNADTEKAKIEWDYARTYCVYIDLDIRTADATAYLTVVDYSIYTK